MATFHLMKDKKGQFRFKLVAKNGETVAVSESYKAKPAALKTIDKIKGEAKAAKVIDETIVTKAAPAKKASAPSKKAVPKPAKKPAMKAKAPAAKPKAAKPKPAAPAVEPMSAPTPAPETTPVPAADASSAPAGG